MKRPSALFAVLLFVPAVSWAAESSALKVILDSDGYSDYDDVTGVLIAALSPEVDLRGVVATGKDGEGRARTIAKALAIAGRDDVTVYVGEPPTSPEPSFSYMGQFPRRWHGLRPELERWASDFQYVPPSRSGVQFLLDAVAAHPGEITVIVTGPLSTLGEAMRVADERAGGEAFRRSIRQVLFSGGDFATAEYNVYIDVGAARRVFQSGVPLYQFGGEGEGKAYLTRDHRERLWRARTPATWALQDLYRLYRAGWDPTSPFVPILYDVHPVAFLLLGESLCRFEPMRVSVDPNGRLLRESGPPNAWVRVANRGDRLVEWAVERLTSPLPAGAFHLVRARAAASPVAPEVAAATAALIEPLSGPSPADLASTRPALDDLAQRLDRLGAAGQDASWHLTMARGYLLGETRHPTWRDPYTPATIRIVVLANAAYRLLTHPRVLMAGLAALGVAILALALIRVARSRRGGCVS